MAPLFTLGAIIAWIGIACGIASLLALVFLYLNGEIADEDDRMLGDWPNVPREMAATRIKRGDGCNGQRPSNQDTFAHHANGASR